MKYDYKVKRLLDTLDNMRKDEWFIPKLRCSDDWTINLDEGAIKLLIAYYSNSDMKSSGELWMQI